jgi:protein-disulfide isomerase
VIEYLDYNCPVCRRTDVEIEKLLAGDARIRVVYKDWPIFGAASGTPALIIGDRLVAGGLDAAQLRLLVADVRMGESSDPMRKSLPDVRR